MSRFVALLLLSGLCLADAPSFGQEGLYRRTKCDFDPNGKAGFTAMAQAQTGILFSNRLSLDRACTNSILANGSGVALGDVDGDGWCDIYFASLDGRNALYRNLGNWKFEDITRAAGVECQG